MATIDITETLSSAVRRQISQFRALVQRYHTDADYRCQVEADPVAAFREQGMELPSNIAVRVLANTDDTRYVIIPLDPNMDLRDEMLATVAGGSGIHIGTAGTISTTGTAGCATAPVTIGTAGTASTVSN